VPVAQMETMEPALAGFAAEFRVPSWLTAAAAPSALGKTSGSANTTVAGKSGLVAPFETIRTVIVLPGVADCGATALICESET